MTLGNFNPIRLTDLLISCALRLAKRAQCEAATMGTRSVFAGSAPPSGEDSNDELPCRFCGERETQTVLGHHKGRWTAEVSAGCWNNGSVPRALITYSQPRTPWPILVSRRRRGVRSCTPAQCDPPVPEHIGILCHRCERRICIFEHEFSAGMLLRGKSRRS